LRGWRLSIVDATPGGFGRLGRGLRYWLDEQRFQLRLSGESYSLSQLSSPWMSCAAVSAASRLEAALPQFTSMLDQLGVLRDPSPLGRCARGPRCTAHVEVLKDRSIFPARDASGCPRSGHHACTTTPLVARAATCCSEHCCMYAGN